MRLAKIRWLQPRSVISNSVAALRRQGFEHRGWPDGQVAQPNSSRRENGISYGGRDDCRARFAETYRSLDALNELNVEIRNVADAKRSVAVQVCVFDLAFYELASLMECQADAPKGAAFDLSERAVRVNKRTCVDSDCEFFNCYTTAATIDADACDASGPCGHGATLAKCAGNA